MAAFIDGLLATTAPALDDLLLDMATTIELSNHDRRVAENRYRRLKEHLERPSSPLAQYLVAEGSHIYPQGSMATGTTVVYGTDEDRFDLDAMVEMNVPPEWSNDQALDLLYKALENFPDTNEVVRCTRCVQMRFASMHMDVTVMDPKEDPRPERAGEIFHSPDTGESARVPANPYGFSQWFRAHVRVTGQHFSEILNERRAVNGVDRLPTYYNALDEAKQDDLPKVLPPRLDAEQAVALKLLKRFLYTRYQTRPDTKRVPSIYLAKLAVDAGPTDNGLCHQLEKLATFIKSKMEKHINSATQPDERNPAYDLDRLNDRWPKDKASMELLAGDMTHLLDALEQARGAEFSDITKAFTELFGEKLTKRSVDSNLKRNQKGVANKAPSTIEKGTGTIMPAGAVAAAAVVRSPVPQHNFHFGVAISTKK